MINKFAIWEKGAELNAITSGRDASHEVSTTPSNAPHMMHLDAARMHLHPQRLKEIFSIPAAASALALLVWAREFSFQDCGPFHVVRHFLVL